MEFLFILPFLLMLAGILKVKVYEPFANGTRKIDPLKHPMLYRSQRIIRYKNVTAREREQKFLAQARVKKEQKALEAIENESFERLNDSQAHHKELTDFFDKMFHEYDAPDREVKRLEAIEADRIAAAEKRAKLDEYEKSRVRELEMWTIAEKKRIADFKAAQAIQEADDRAERAVKKRKLEEYYAAAQNLTAAGGLIAPRETVYDTGGWTPVRGSAYPDSGSYGDRSVVVHGVYARLRANKTAQILNNFAQYDKISVDGWTVGEELYGNPIWFHQKPGDGYLAGWIWSGALNNHSTSGIPRLEDETQLRDETVSDSLDRLRELSGRELAALQTRIKDEFESYSHSMDNPTHADVDKLNMLADASEAVHHEQDIREQRMFAARRTLTNNSMNALETLTQMHANPQMHTTDREIAELQAEIAVLDERINPTPIPTPKEAFGNPWNGTISANKITGTKIHFGNGVTMSEHGITGLHRT